MSLTLLGVLFAMFAAHTRLAHATVQCTTTCYVATTGLDSNTGLSGDPFLTIQKAVDTVDAGGTVIIAAGTYQEQVTISKAVSVQGAGAGSTTVQLNSMVYYFEPETFIVNAAANDTVELTGMTISTNGTCGSAISFNTGNGNIHNNTLQAPTAPNCTGDGIDIGNQLDSSKSATATISDNTIDDYPASGVMLNNASSATISGNTITGGPSALGTESGINVQGSSSATITGNTISNNLCQQLTYHFCGFTVNELQTGNGISIFTTGNVTASGNTLSGNGTGIQAFQGGTVTLSSNTIASPYFGMTLSGATFQLTGNTISGGQYGLVIMTFGAIPPVPPNQPGYPAVPVTVTGSGNSISGTGTGVYVAALGTNPPAPSVTLNRNAITGNTTGFDNTTTTNADATCNWWGAANGPGGVGPGSGDSVSANVTFQPWLITSDLTALCGAEPAPKGTYVTPYAQWFNQPVVLHGFELTGTSQVLENGVPSLFTVLNDNNVSIIVNPAAGAGVVQLVYTTPQGTFFLNNAFAASAPPTVPIIIPQPTTTPPPPPPVTCTVETLTLSGRWTLIAGPGANTPVQQALGASSDGCTTSVAAQISVIWGWDPVSQTWLAFFPGTNAIGANDLATLTRGMGYFVALVNPSQTLLWKVETGS